MQAFCALFFHFFKFKILGKLSFLVFRFIISCGIMRLREEDFLLFRRSIYFGWRYLNRLWNGVSLSPNTLTIFHHFKFFYESLFIFSRLQFLWWIVILISLLGCGHSLMDSGLNYNDANNKIPNHSPSDVKIVSNDSKLSMCKAYTATQTLTR